MQDRFAVRQKQFAGEGKLSAFNLAMVAEGLDVIAELNEQNVGGQVVEQRLGEFKSWDPEILKVDRDVESQYIKRLAELDVPIVLLSEEAGREEVNPSAEGARYYCVCDPFDGSYLIQHGIPDFWYSSMAFYNADFRPACCAVGDGVHRKIAFANENGAFIADLVDDHFEHRFQLNDEFRKGIGRPGKQSPEGASIESYAMKPTKFLFPLVDRWRDVLAPFKFLLPNGGPYGFVDVAEGKIDCYFAPGQPFMDVFSGVQIAEKAGVIVTDFDDKPIRCSDDVETVHDVLASVNRSLHEQVLELIQGCRG